MSSDVSKGFGSARIPELDGLRGCAILMVVGFHYIVGFDYAGAISPIAKLWLMGWTGVDLFFVLSGFLIGGILMDQRKSENLFKVFFLRRICRIFPLYFLWLGLFFLLPAVWPWMRTTEPLDKCFDSMFPQWTYFFFLQNFFTAKLVHVDADWMCITWSLAVEEQFYLVLPFFIRFLPRRSLLWTLLATALGAPVLRLLLYIFYPGGELAAYVLLPCRADALVAGVLCAYAVRSERVLRHITPRLLRLSLPVFLTGVLFLGLTASWMHSFEMASWGYSWMALFYSCVLLFVVTSPNHWGSSLLRLQPLRKIGEISFGIYLFHDGVNSLWHGLWLRRGIAISTPQDALATLASFCSTLVLAWCSWKFFEKPIVDFGHNFKYRKAEQDSVSGLLSTPLSR